jgi:hypothetical protein
MNGVALPRILPLAFLAASCGGESRPQIVKGQVDRAMFPVVVTEARAWRDDTLMATSPLDLEGGFLLVLPIGGPYRFELATVNGGDAIPLLDVNGTELRLQVCTVKDPIFVGALYPQEDPCRSFACSNASAQSAECQKAAADLHMDRWQELGCENMVELDCSDPNGMNDERSCACFIIEEERARACIPLEEEENRLCFEPSPDCRQQFVAMALEMFEPLPMSCDPGDEQ